MKFNFPDKKKSLLNPSITEIIDKLQIGDILTYYNGKSGNSIMIYDIIKDKINNNTKVLVIYSDGGIGKAYVNSKIPHLLYLNKKKNPNFDNWEQGSIGIQNINKYSQWMDINKTGLNYSIIRYIHNDTNGNAIFYKFNKDINDNITNGNKIYLSPENMDRINYKNIYIEKIVDKFNDNIVENGQNLTYKIIIKNEGPDDYYNLYIKEILSEYVEYINDNNNKFKYNNGILEYNICKLKKGENITIEYTVKVKGQIGQIINSYGYVNNIPSSTIRNVIGKNLDNNEELLINKTYYDLKNNSYNNGKIFINEIYKEAFNINLELDKFDITKLIINSPQNNTKKYNLTLNESHILYKSVLNKYWSALYKNENDTKIDFDLRPYPSYLSYTDPKRRQDFIYKETFKIGDILIYYNNHDTIINKTNHR